MGILDDLTKNPSLLALAGIGIALFVFRDKISSFASGISGGAESVSNLGETSNILTGNLLGSLEGIQDIFKGVTDFEFPKFEFPKIEFPDFNIDLGLGDLFKGGNIEDPDITGTPQNESRANRDRSVTEIIKNIIPQENLNVQTEIENQTFQGGGLSFIGGTVRETPITGQSTLGFIIDKLGVTASQASNIRAEAGDDFGGFDFGTNTGMGLSNLFENVGQTSDESFTGLTPEEIALRLTGGNISNF